MQLEPLAGSAHRSTMSPALRLPPRMTVAEFLEWEPPSRSGALWQLRDGEPEMMTPASDRHGAIQTELGYLLTAHFRRTGRPCTAVTAPGVVPAERSEDNCLVLDLGITCTPPTGAHLMEHPLVLIEVLSPTDVSRTPPDGAWQLQPDVQGPDGELRLDSIGFATPLREVYRTSGLT